MRVNTKEGRSIEKAVILIAGLGTRFLPLSKEVPKELWPLVDKPVLQYVVEEAIASGIKEIIFVSRPEKRLTWDYFTKKDKELKVILKEREKEEILKELTDFEKIFEEISFPQLASFSRVFQKRPLGNGHAIIQVKKRILNEPIGVLFADDVVEAKTPCLLQLIRIFEKYKKPVIALSRLPKERLSSYGVVKVKKIANRLYKIEKIVEKPSPQEAPSNLAIVGKYILTPEVFEYLERAKPEKGEEIHLSENLEKMLEDEKEIYGYEFEGKWLECGDKLAYLKSNLYLSLKHPQFGKNLKKYLKKI